MKKIERDARKAITALHGVSLVDMSNNNGHFYFKLQHGERIFTVGMGSSPKIDQQYAIKNLIRKITKYIEGKR